MPSNDETLIIRAGTLIPSLTVTAHPSQTIRPAGDARPTLGAAVEEVVEVEEVLGTGGMALTLAIVSTIRYRQYRARLG